MTPCFVKKKKKINQFKKQLTGICWYKEVNRTDPSISVRVPCLLKQFFLMTWHPKISFLYTASGTKKKFFFAMGTCS
jgi:hypothetical protein